jgi:hypothetical protein
MSVSKANVDYATQKKRNAKYTCGMLVKDMMM